MFETTLVEYLLYWFVYLYVAAFNRTDAFPPVSDLHRI